MENFFRAEKILNLLFAPLGVFSLFLPEIGPFSKIPFETLFSPLWNLHDENRIVSNFQVAFSAASMCDFIAKLPEFRAHASKLHPPRAHMGIIY